MKKRVNELANLMEQIQINQATTVHKKQPQLQTKMFHPMRAVFIALDMTKTIQMKDFKPSRLSVATQMIKQFIRKSKQKTPLIQYSFAVVQEQICKIILPFTLDSQGIFDAIDLLKVQNNGFFSLENVLRSALQSFESISNCYKKQLLIVQASSLTKDYRNIFQTIDLFQQAKIQVNIISMVGWTHVFRKLVEKTDGKYATVSTNEEFKNYIQEISLPAQLAEETVQKIIFKVALCKKQYSQKGVQCFCHFKKVKNYYVCGFCNAVSCKVPPIQCSVCKKLIILPSDLSRHKLIESK